MNIGDDCMLIERFIEDPHHIEIQCIYMYVINVYIHILIHLRKYLYFCIHIYQSIFESKYTCIFRNICMKIFR